MILHEQVNMTGSDYYTIMTETNLNFGTHFHQAIEICCVLDGSALFCIDGGTFEASSGEAIAIMSDLVHSISTPEFSKIKIIRFRPEIAGTFCSEYLDKVPLDPKFKLTSELKLTEECVRVQNIYTVKGIVYMLMSDLCSQCGGWKDRMSDGSIVHEMLKIAENEFDTAISLKTVSERLNYNYAYLSRIFCRTIGMSFNEYLNNCRVNRSCMLLKNTDLPVTEIAHKTGFRSIRSFNRNFVKYSGSTPCRYRESPAV